MIIMNVEVEYSNQRQSKLNFHVDAIFYNTSVIGNSEGTIYALFIRYTRHHYFLYRPHPPWRMVFTNYWCIFFLYFYRFIKQYIKMIIGSIINNWQDKNKGGKKYIYHKSLSRTNPIKSQNVLIVFYLSKIRKLKWITRHFISLKHLWQWILRFQCSTFHGCAQ